MTGPRSPLPAGGAGDGRVILDLLPHRPPFLFLTELVSLAVGESGSALWRVSGAEAFFLGHFPGRAVVPGTLLTEALAQLSGLVGFSDGGSNGGGAGSAGPGAAGEVKLVHVEMRFKESVVPPAEIELRSRACGAVGILHQFEVEARRGGRVAARGRVMLARMKNEK